MEKCFIVVENTSIEELKKIIEEIKTNDYPSIFIPSRDVDIHSTKDNNRFVVTTFIYQTSQFLDFCDAFFHAALRHQVTSMGWIKRADKTLIGLPKRQWIRCAKNNSNEDDITLLDEDNQVYEIIERKDKQISAYEWERVVVVKKTDKYSCQAFYKPDTQYGNAVYSICIGLKTFRHDDSELPIYNIRLPFLTKRLGEYSCAYVGIVGCLALFSGIGLKKYSDTLLPGISTFLWPLGLIGFGTILVFLPVIIRRIRTGHSKVSGINCVLKVLIISLLTNSILFSTNSYFHDPEPIYLHGTILDKYSFIIPPFRWGSGTPIYLVDATIDKYPNTLSMHIRIDKDDPWHKGDSCEVMFYKGLFGMLVVDSVHHP